MPRLKSFWYLIIVLLLGSVFPAIAKDDIDVNKNLVAAAIEAQKLAYCPYSNYPVGAAILTKHGEIISASNVENASYGLCICAERNAVFKAVSEGKKEFTAIAVVTKDGGFSCGACRQVINEFSPNILLIVAKDNGEIVKEIQLNEILPYAFGPANMGK